MKEEKEESTKRYNGRQFVLKGKIIELLVAPIQNSGLILILLMFCLYPLRWKKSIQHHFLIVTLFLTILLFVSSSSDGRNQIHFLI